MVGQKFSESTSSVVRVRVSRDQRDGDDGRRHGRNDEFVRGAGGAGGVAAVSLAAEDAAEGVGRGVAVVDLKGQNQIYTELG